MNQRQTDSPGFAPDAPTDNRPEGHWKTRYPEPEAQNAIRFEAILLALCFLGWIVLTILLFRGDLSSLLALNPPLATSFLKYGAASLGGFLGGTLLSVKWLYHSVAKDIWNRDRRLWRLFTPFVSTGLAFATVLLISSKVMAIFDSQSLRAPGTSMGIGFIVGYFSDSALAKLQELAATLFGARERHR